MAVLGANVATALFGRRARSGKSFLLGGDRYFVVGVLAPRKGTFFGENRNDNVVAHAGGHRAPQVSRTPRTRCSTCAPSRACASRRGDEAETILRLLRSVPPGRRERLRDEHAPTRSSRSSIASASQIFLATVALAAVSLVIGGIGIANVMVISVTERTREIGVRLAIGARRREVLRQFLFEAAMLSGAGGVAGVVAGHGARACWRRSWRRRFRPRRRCGRWRRAW